MNMKDEHLVSLRLESVRLAGGDLTLAKSILDFLTAETPNDLASKAKQDVIMKITGPTIITE